MSTSHQTISFISKDKDVSLYRINRNDTANRYYILSSDKSHRLLAHPEVVSMDAYYALLAPTAYAFSYLLSQGHIENPEICTILRGGLNYPLEEACYKASLPVANIHFLSCERIIEEGIIAGLEVKYNKLSANDGVTLMIGDILASGMTFNLCIHKIIEAYKESGCRLKRILFFTIGGTRAFDIFDRLTEELGAIWPAFEGVDCFFYEGAFSVYEEKGILGFQVPQIDFYWNGGLIAPEYRQYCMQQITPIMEKCVIYDGGARRYNIPEHKTEVLDYWQRIKMNADDIDAGRLFDERVGYPATNDFNQWLEYTGYQNLDCKELKQVFELENQCREKLININLLQFAQNRIDEITNALDIF